MIDVRSIVVVALLNEKESIFVEQNLQDEIVRVQLFFNVFPRAQRT